MVLEGEIVKLRPLRSLDLEALHTWRDDLQLRGLVMMHPFPVTLEQDMEWLDGIMNDTGNKQVVFAIESKSDGLLNGYVHLKGIDYLHRHAFLGIMIGLSGHRQKGLGSESIRMLIKYGFDFLGLEKISLEVGSRNEIALRVYEKIGFEVEGIFRKHFFFQGVYHDVTRMAIFKETQAL